MSPTNLLMLLVGVALGSVAVVVARPRGSKKPSKAKVCGDLKLIRDGERADAKAAFDKGDDKAGKEHSDNANYTEKWAKAGGCGWAA
jgi:gas vesicle protein